MSTKPAELDPKFSPSLPLAQVLAFGIPALSLAGAYIAQYGFGLYPCEMCWWQRYPHFAAILFAVLALVVPGKGFWLALAAAAITLSGMIGGFHAGVEYGWWPGMTTCTTSISASAGNALDAIMNAPLVRCDVAPWTLLGVSLAGWNALFSTLGGLAIFRLLGLREQP